MQIITGILVVLIIAIGIYVLFIKKDAEDPGLVTDENGTLDLSDTPLPTPTPTSVATTPTPAVAPTPVTPTAPPPTADGFDYKIDMRNYKYSVTEMVAKPGQTLKVKITTLGGTHSFVIDDLNVQTNVLTAGESQDLEIKIPASAAPGTTYEYYCMVSNHHSQGMKGKIVVQ